MKVSDDLISRSELLKNINNNYYDTKNDVTRRMDYVTKAQICELIDHQPTVYDVDKVLEQLENVSIEELGINRTQFKMDEGEYSSYCSLSLYDVKEIVKSGGVN